MPLQTLTQIQQKLADLGLYHDVVDGRAGPNTKAAVRAFQQSVKIDDDGIPGNQTLAWLFPTAVIPSLGRDLDPPTAQPSWAKSIWPRQPDVERFYGRPGENLTKLILPYKMKLSWLEDGKAYWINSFQIHEKVHDSALRCYNRIADAYDEEARAEIGIDIFGGCFNNRPMRGGSRKSMHAWAIAIDTDPDRNTLHQNATTARLAKSDCEKFWRIWEDEGWVSLGRIRDFDWMHVQAARL